MHLDHKSINNNWIELFRIMLDFSKSCKWFFMVALICGLILISVSLLLIQTELVEYWLHFFKNTMWNNSRIFFSRSSKWISWTCWWDFYMCALHLLWCWLFVSLLNGVVIYSMTLMKQWCNWTGICYQTKFNECCQSLQI